jgi:hypothetical protein
VAVGVVEEIGDEWRGVKVGEVMSVGVTESEGEGRQGRYGG